MTDSNNSTPKLHIDDDWKSQAQAEKQRLAEKTASSTPSRPSSASARPSTSSRREPPKPDLANLINTYAAQALLYMGFIPDPQTGQRLQALDLARHQIDTLAMLEDKTKGNLTEDESSALASTLYELRTRYIQSAQSALTK